MNDIGLFFSRVALGAGIAAHGAQKAFGAFEGPGPAGAAQYLTSLGFSPGKRFATAASWTELVSGGLIVLGLGGPIGPAALISTMVVAQTAVHAKNGFFAQKNGIELGVLYGAGALALASAGYGRFSLDETFGWQKIREPWLATLAVAGGIVTGCLVLAQRAFPDPAPALDHVGAADHAAVSADARPLRADSPAASDG
jgi:putative oxidoreductase